MPTADDILDRTARAALCAPSPLNTQPWTWQVRDGGLELYADRDRQLAVADPHGHFLTLSCGIALHHARVSLTAQGYGADIERFVRSFQDERLARLTVGERRPVNDAELALARAIRTRQTDRRPFADRPVAPRILAALAAAARAEGARLHEVSAVQVPVLAAAAAQAAAIELADPAYRNELIRWTNRPQWSGDGVPAAATVDAVPRRVPVRPLTIEPHAGVPIEPGGDRGASYLVVFGRRGHAPDWFAAGEAVSAVLLTATSFGLATAPITDVIEVPDALRLVTTLVPAGGHPFVVLRCGWSDPESELSPAPRRDPAEVIVDTRLA